MSFKNKHSRKISATLRRKKEIGGFEKEAVNKYIEMKEKGRGKEKAYSIRAEILHEVNVLKEVRT